MGIIKAQGQRIYMYEGFMIVTSASILGSLAGFVTAVLISSQFYMFIELPLEIYFPWVLLVIMLGIAFVTNFSPSSCPYSKSTSGRSHRFLKPAISESTNPFRLYSFSL